MGGKSSKPKKTDYILDVSWDITESPDKNLFIRLPKNIKGIHILCPIQTSKLQIEIVKLKAHNTCNVIAYMDVFKSIYNVYRTHRYKIIRYAEENDKDVKIFFKGLEFIKNENNIGIYKLKLGD
jgi:hypothetical protein